MDRLGAAANVSISRLPDFLDALRTRHDDFHAHGCRLSDHGLEHCYAESCSDVDAARTFDRLRSGGFVDASEGARFAGYLMLFFGRLDAERGWTKQLHLGAIRNVNSRQLAELVRTRASMPLATAAGAGAGHLSRPPVARAGIAEDRRLQSESRRQLRVRRAGGLLPERGIAGMIQFGSGWWFLDQKEGIEWQLNALSATGLLSRFIGMLTDSRSFMSYPRHEYFRRVLCNLLGTDRIAESCPTMNRWSEVDPEHLLRNAASFLGLAHPRPPEGV
jgi:glucuronate isomerase